MEIRNNKNGMFFTLMSMMIISLLIFALTTPPKNISGIEKIEPVTTRIQTLNDFSSSLNYLYIDTIIKTATFNILQSIGNGIITGNPSDIVKSELEDITDPVKTSAYYWFNELNISAGEAYHSDFRVNRFAVKSVTQQNNEPFIVTVEYDIDYTINTLNPHLFWNIVKNSSVSRISILNLPDPEYPGEVINLDDYFSDEQGLTFLQKLGKPAAEYDSNKLCPASTCP